MKVLLDVSVPLEDVEIDENVEQVSKPQVDGSIHMGPVLDAIIKLTTATKDKAVRVLNVLMEVLVPEEDMDIQKAVMQVITGDFFQTGEKPTDETVEQVVNDKVTVQLPEEGDREGGDQEISGNDESPIDDVMRIFRKSFKEVLVYANIKNLSITSESST